MPRGKVFGKATIIGAPPPPPGKLRVMFRMEYANGRTEAEENSSIVVFGLSLEEARQATDRALREAVGFKARVQAARAEPISND